MWISDRGYVERDDAGQVIRISGVATDITWRKQAEQALRDREAQYRAVIETTPDGFAVTDMNGRLLEVNDAYVRLSGYTRDELRSMEVSDLEAIETPAETRSDIARIRQTGSDIFETMHRTRDGRIWPVEPDPLSGPMPVGDISHFSATSQNRKMVQSELRRWADAFENCRARHRAGRPGGGADPCLQSAFALLLGRTVDELVGAEI